MPASEGPRSYAATRRLVLAAGLGVLVLLAAVMYARRVDTVEVLAVLLFIPMFLALVFKGLLGGALSAVAATVVYALLRSPAREAVGDGRFASLVLSRGVGYVAFGVLGGWASAQLARSLDKLEVYDQVDDATGLFNARFFVQDTGMELARAQRYQTLFSVCVVDVDASGLETLSRRRRAALLADLGAQMKAAVRSVDRAVHARDSAAHRFAVVCPETGSEGATIFVDRLAERLAAFLSTRGVPTAAADIRRTACTFPGDDGALQALRDQFAAIDRAENPDSGSRSGNGVS
ncbi:MAG: hypothetical protein KY458_06080 [Actinobacteria bacterium]|nr:hypothetical protein [Actinomycetota bacterium]